MSDETFGEVASRLESEATEGLWASFGRNVARYSEGIESYDDFATVNDARFIAFARNCWPEILALVEAVEGQRWPDAITQRALDDLNAKAREVSR